MNAIPNYRMEFSPEQVAAQTKRAEDERAYQTELAKQKAAGIPQWMDAYNNFKKNDPNFVKMQKDAGYYEIDRPWNADDGTRTLKTNLDGDYKGLLDAYNKEHGTNYQPDARQIGVDNQPNDWDHKRNSNSGFLSDTISHVGEVVSKSKLAQTVISMAAAAYGVPPNVTMALLAGNNIAQGQDPAEVAKGIAMSYLGDAAGNFVGGAAKGALSGSGLVDNVTGALTNLASGAAKQLATTGKVNAQGLLTNAAGNVVTGSDTFKDLSADASQYFKDAGLDKIDIGGFSIPGSGGGQIIPGLDRNSLPVRVAETAIKNTPGYKQVNSAVNAVKGIPTSLTNQIVKTISGGSKPSGANIAADSSDADTKATGVSGIDINALLASISGGGGGGGGGQAAPAAAPTQNSWAGVELGPDYFDRAASSPTNSSVADLLGLINARA
jgi:hypothetical protein